MVFFLAYKLFISILAISKNSLQFHVIKLYAIVEMARNISRK